MYVWRSTAVPMRRLKVMIIALLLCPALFFHACASQDAQNEVQTPAASVSAVPSLTPTAVPTATPDPVYYPDIRGAFDQVDGEAQKILLSFVGDCTLGCNERDHGNKKSIDAYIDNYGYDYCFSRVRSILEQDDLTIANFEGTLHDSSTGINKKTYNFRSDRGYVNILKSGSVEAVTLGNNHTGDYGAAGFEDTIQTFADNGISWFGSTDFSAQSYIYEKGNVRIGFVGANITYYWQNTEKIKTLMAQLDEAGCALTIAVIHGGVEYDQRHDANQTRMAQRFIDWGADIVIGHHPHRLQGYEVLSGVPVFYSLGNFVFGGNFNLKSKYTAIVQFALSFDAEGNYMGYQSNVIPCRLSSDETVNYYQPFPITGRQAELAIKEIQRDTKKFWPISNYVEGIGALQPYTAYQPAQTASPSPAPSLSPAP